MEEALTCFARVITWVEGVPLSDCRGQANGALDRALGQVMGAVSVALQHFEPREDGADSSERVLAWDLANVSKVSRPYLNELFDDEVKERVTKALDAFDAFVNTGRVVVEAAIHGDANDENILVARRPVPRHLHESSPGMMEFWGASERLASEFDAGRRSWCQAGSRGLRGLCQELSRV